MSDEEKFDGFKRKLIEDNEKGYGKEIREKYGEESVKRSNEGFRRMSEQQYKELRELEKEIFVRLREAYKEGDPAGELGQRTAELHKKWITLCWGNYNAEAHANLAQMYVDDVRFKSYYDKEQTGSAMFLRDAVKIYTEKI